MPSRDKASQWSRSVKDAIRRFVDAGIQEAAHIPLFEWCEHVSIRVQGLEGVGVIHQQDPSGPYRLCAFEPSQREPGGFAEIFERTMDSLDQLPERVDEWRSFRSGGVPTENAAGLADHHAWLRLVAKEKKKCLDAVRESARLREAGDVDGAWEAAGFDLRIKSPPSPDTPPVAKERLLEDLAAIAPDLLAWHLPRDDKGKWVLGRRVPLFRYDGDRRRMSAFCLVAAMPDKRSGRPEIRGEWLQADLQTARLDAVPEMIDTRRLKTFAPELLGVDSGKACALWSSRGSSRAAVPRTLRLQYAGRFEEAGKLAGLELDDAVLGCMQARRVAHMCTCCAPLDRQLIEWSAVAKRALTALNLPRVVALALRDQERCGRKPRKEPIPIVPFPLQRHIRKAHLALDLREPGHPRLTVDMTGSGVRLPVPLWKRPVDVDLLRDGLLDIGDLPEAVKLQLGVGE